MLELGTCFFIQASHHMFIRQVVHLALSLAKGYPPRRPPGLGMFLCISARSSTWLCKLLTYLRQVVHLAFYIVAGLSTWFCKLFTRFHRVVHLVL